MLARTKVWKPSDPTSSVASMHGQAITARQFSHYGVGPNWLITEVDIPAECSVALHPSLTCTAVQRTCDPHFVHTLTFWRLERQTQTSPSLIASYYQVLHLGRTHRAELCQSVDIV